MGFLLWPFAVEQKSALEIHQLQQIWINLYSLHWQRFVEKVRLSEFYLIFLRKIAARNCLTINFIHKVSAKFLLYFPYTDFLADLRHSAPMNKLNKCAFKSILSK